MLAARLAGTPWRDATSLGILMNTRGLMELLILNIGLDIGVMTTPLLEWVYPASKLRAQSGADVVKETWRKRCRVTDRTIRAP